MKSLWTWFWNSSNRLLFAGTLFVAGVVMWGGFNTFMEATNKMEFCVGCHEMRDNVYAEYKQTIHYTNRSGVRAICSDCHVPKEWVPKLLRKIRATKELYHWALGTIDTPEKFEAHRLELAKNVWSEMQGNQSHECRNCHAYDAMHWEKQGDRAQKGMKAAIKEGLSCIECHKGIAHKLPALEPAFEAMGDALAKQAAGETLSGEVTTFTAKALSMAKDGSGKAAAVEPLTPLEILETDGDMVKVRLTAWDREGGLQLFAKPGPQMQVAKVGIDGMDVIQQKAEFIDKETELTWHQVSVEGWTSKEGLTANKDSAWGYAEEMWKLDCNLCHNQIDRQEYNAYEWGKQMLAMRRFTKLTQEQQAVVLKYVQNGSSDMVKMK
ncbi:NapC/NirT family cytochrome c [Magnetospira sp. QH-2]|uniref:NapC/NirT family cytochrome c n=1 Tax=Magnetospira sp. (strain QH-2) TaxID=1288970 RepID=UPI0003E8115F|nr:NapC/NirT family cytochrome c [Magnetospira sp. QH-2]CCQ75085.1 putative membrane-bound tetraheme cytochrome TorC [Magnetospira sp. QH-2]